MEARNESTMSAVSDNARLASGQRTSWSGRALVWIGSALLLLNSAALGSGFNPAPAINNQRGTVMADEQEDPVLAAEKRRTALLEQQTKQLEEKAKQAEARKKLRDAQLGDIEVKPLEGDTKVDDKVKIEAEILAHGAMAEIAKAIAEDLRQARVTRVTVHNEAAINAMLAYRAFQSQVSSYVARYDKLLNRTVPSELLAAKTVGPQGFAPLLGDVTAITKSIIGLAALFRSDLVINGVETSVQEPALVAELARQLNNGHGQVEVYYPAVFKPGVLARDAVKESPTLKTLEPLYARVDSSKEVLAQLTLALAFVRQKLGTPDLAEADSRKLQAQQADLQLWQELLADLNAEVKTFIAGLTAVDEETGVNVFSQLIKAEGLIRLNDAETGKEQHVLALRIEKQGGANVIKKNLFTHLFTGDRLTHTGGAIISYILFNQQGAIAKSGLLYRNSPRTKNQRIGDNFAGRLRQSNETAERR